MKRQLNYTCAIVVCHGKTEEEFIKYIKRNLRLNIKVITDTTSIQINGLLNFLKKKYKSFKDLTSNIEVNIGKKNTILNEFKIFTIMDTDDCDEQTFKNYKNKRLFDTFTFKDYLVPIYNINEIEDVFVKSKIYKAKPHDGDKIKELRNHFPITNSNECELDVISNLSQKFNKLNNTNMNEMLDYFLEIAEGKIINK